MTAKMYLALALHNHQPVGNFDNVFEIAYNKAYLPMLEALERHPKIRLAIHNSGCLIDWLKVAHPEYLERLTVLVARNQIEIMTGGYHEPILVSLPDKDKRGQIKKLTKTVRRTFDYEPTGAWLAERVWEPHLPTVMHKEGVEYTIVDDTHFRYAGLDDDDMFGYYVTEDMGNPVKIFGTAKHLRYTVPWVGVDEVIAWLREQATRDLPKYNHVKRVAVMGDDGEKFGMWPRTYQHCWVDGWVERFFTAIEENSDWLETITLADYAKNEGSLGQIYIPAASYDEMTEWSLPAGSSAELITVKEQLKAKADDTTLKYIKGGMWRGFLAKYPEVNLMHKKFLHVSDKVHKMSPGKQRKAALNLLWKAQCNCGYWHGLFGGIYLFHIRGENYRNLISAEKIADSTRDVTLEARYTDFTRNATKDLIVANKHQWLLFDPANGGSLVEWDFRAAPYNLLNNMSRRPEAYHQALIDAVAAGAVERFSDAGAVENAHSHTVRVQQDGLGEKLIFDWYRRAALQDRFLGSDITLDQYRNLEGELGDFVNQPYSVEFVEQARRVDVILSRDGGVWQDGVFLPVQIMKEIVLDRGSSQLTVHYTLANNSNQTLNTRFGIENNWGLEGGQDGLTFFEGLETPAGDRQYPGHIGTASGIDQYALNSDIVTVGTGIQHTLSVSADIWWFPIESVTNSESGFEANYQGTAILNSWQLNLAPAARWQVTLTFDLTKRDP